MNKLYFLILFFLPQFSSHAQVTIEWQNTIGGIGPDELYSIAQTSDGGYICGGLSLADYWVVKLDALGNIQWQNTIGGSNIDYLYSIAQTSDGGYMCGDVHILIFQGTKPKIAREGMITG